MSLRCRDAIMIERSVYQKGGRSHIGQLGKIFKRKTINADLHYLTMNDIDYIRAKGLRAFLSRIRFQFLPFPPSLLTCHRYFSTSYHRKARLQYVRQAVISVHNSFEWIHRDALNHQFDFLILMRTSTLIPEVKLNITLHEILSLMLL